MRTSSDARLAHSTCAATSSGRDLKVARPPFSNPGAIWTDFLILGKWLEPEPSCDETGDGVTNQERLWNFDGPNLTFWSLKLGVLSIAVNRGPMGDNKYQLCPCGSGKKLKFCCYETHRTLDQLSDEELFRRAAEFPIYESRVSLNWQEAGIAEVLIVRQTPRLKYVAGVYLVDVFCLGLKDTFVTITSKYTDIQSLHRGLCQKLEEISYEDGRSIILGAVEYACRHGFEPHEDWTLSGPIVEPNRSFRPKFTFGHNGKPFYIQGPNDPPDIMAKLWPLIENEKAHFLSVSHDVSLDERCDQIERELQDGLLEKAHDELEGLMDEHPGRWEPLFLMGTCLALQ